MPGRREKVPDPAEPGWHPDPSAPRVLRYWDGERWSRLVTHTRVEPQRPDDAPRPQGPDTIDGRTPRRAVWVVAPAVVAVLAVAVAVVWVRPGDAPRPVISMAAIDGGTCALRDSSVWCWGALGGPDGHPTQVMTDAVHLAGGGDRVCAVRTGGRPFCWSDGEDPTAVELTDVVDVAVGSDHACAVRMDESVWCWGANRRRELGAAAPDNDSGEPRSPVRVPVEPASAVAVGTGFSCVALVAGPVHCWGDPYWGQVGAATDEGTNIGPTAVAGLDDVTAVAASAGHACAVISDGEVRCWGDNRRGQLGAGSGDARSDTPVAVIGLRDVDDLAASPWSTCARTADGELSCWGDDTFGQLGSGRSADPRLQPVAVDLADRVRAVVAGPFHTCASFEDGTITCWGANGSGQLGDGTTRDSAQPVEVILSEN